MKNFYLSALFFSLIGLSCVPAHAEIDARPLPTDTRIVVFNFEDNNTYTILTRPYSSTDIQLGKDEELVAFVMGDTSQWESDQVAGHIFIKPHKADLFNSATLVTTKRTYQMTLKSSGEKGKWYQAVSWRYPQVIKAAQQQQQQLAREIKSAAEAERRHQSEVSAGKISLSPEKLNFEYDISGDASFRPSQVFDDGKFTWLRITKTQDHPALFMLNGGEAELVNYVVKGDYLVVQRLVKSLLLKLGDEEVRITNKGH